MIIVEGCDNAGKTTLVAKLSAEHRLLTLNHRQRPLSLQDSRDYLHLVTPLAQRFKTIFDRWQPISEPIYGPICRNTHLFEPADIAEQHSYLRLEKLNPLIIYCRPSAERILNFGDREQMEGVIDNAKKIIDGYDRMMDWIAGYWFPVVRYDYEHDTYDSLSAKVLAYYEGKPK